MSRMLCAVLLATSGLTWAEEHEPEAPAKEAHAKGEAAEGKGGEAEEHEHEAEPILEYTVDLALGSATFEALAPDATVDALTFQRSSFFVASLLLGAEHDFGHFTAGVRLPVLMGSMTVVDTKSSSGVTPPLLGNVEVEGGFHTALGEHWNFFGVLEVALPTAMGSEAPAAGETSESLDHAAILRGELLRAAAFSRGTLDSTLFEPGRVGVIPKLAVEFHTGQFTLRPEAKVEALIATKAAAAEPVVLELIAGVRAGYTFAHLIEPNVHVWTNLTLTKHAEENVNVVLVEPGVRFFAGHLQPSLSVVVPVYGRLLTDSAFSVRVGLVGEI